MKSITITIDDEVYRAASEEAARLRKSLSELAQEFIERMSRKGAASGQLGSEEAGKAREEFARFLDELDARPLKDGPSVGPLNREELDRHGVQAEPGPLATVEETESEKQRKRREEFAQFFAELNARPRQEGPSVGPLNREEIYQRGVRGY